jgi:hypothetical protein
MSESAPGPTCVIDVVVEGTFPTSIEQYARAKIGSLLQLSHEPVLSARVRLMRHADPAATPPVIAKATLDVGGRPIRASVGAAGEREGVDLLEARLRHKLERAARHWEARRGHMSHGELHEWRHDSQPTPRLPYFPRPRQERDIITHAPFGPAVMSVDEAAFEMHQQDYDFYLFTEADTGQDSVLYRTGASGYRLAQVQPVPIRHLETFSLPLTVSDQRPPVLTAAEAVGRLELTGLPFLFYLDVDLARGALVYHRYDGHYGLIRAH